MTMTVEERKAANKALIDEVLKAYPDKMAKRRAKHLGQYEEGKPDCGVKSNIKSLPGVMTIRGCAYAGSKGVVWGPIKDMVHISHGPVGCGQYSRAGRRNYYVGTTGVDGDTFMVCELLQVSHGLRTKADGQKLRRPLLRHVNEGAAVAALAVKPPTVFKTAEPEIFQKRAHSRQVRRSEAYMGDVFDFDHCHCRS